jgi:hypothetical protein
VEGVAFCWYVLSLLLVRNLGLCLSAGVPDGQRDGRQTYTVSIGPAASTSAQWQNAPTTRVSLPAVNFDADNPSLGVLQVDLPAELITYERESAGFVANISLGVPVQATTVVSIASNDTSELTISPSSLTFGPADWFVPQQVALAGVQDHQRDGDQAVLVTVSGTVNGALAAVPFEGTPLFLVQRSILSSLSCASDEPRLRGATGGDASRG